jgi:hypothetical protein
LQRSATGKTKVSEDGNPRRKAYGFEGFANLKRILTHRTKLAFLTERQRMNDAAGAETIVANGFDLIRNLDFGFCPETLEKGNCSAVHHTTIFDHEKRIITINGNSSDAGREIDFRKRRRSSANPRLW